MQRLLRLDYEADLLEVMAEAPSSPVQVPRLLEYGYEQPYIVVSYIPGQVISREEEATLPPEAFRPVVEQLADFMFWFAQAVHTSSQADHLAYYNVPWPRWDQIQSLFWFGLRETKSPPLDALLEEIGDYRTEFLPRQAHPFFGHNDLQFRNIALGGDGRQLHLNGVFDFGLARPSSPEQEMRYLYGLDPRLAELCAARYKAISGEIVNHQRLRLWGTAEYALRMVALLSQHGPYDLFLTAKEGLQRMYPMTDWDSLDWVYQQG